MVKFVLTIVLMFVLRSLYHKMFRVVYFDAVTAIFREFAICFLVAALIVYGAFSQIGSMFTPKEKDPGFYGTYYNLGLLDGSDYITFIMLSNSGDSKDGKMRISGSASNVAAPVFQMLNIENDIPEKNTFTCTDESYQITLTITVDTKNHTLNVVQESGPNGTVFPFSGEYVDEDTWNQMEDEIEAAKEAAIAAQTPNKWIAEYFDEYTSLSYAAGEKGSYPAGFSIREHPSYSDDFILDYHAEANGTFYSQILTLPYPLGDVEPGYLAYNTDSGLIVFEVRKNPASGNTEIEITDCPDAAMIGTYIPSWSQPDKSDIPETGQRLWDGVYTCISDGPDGTKTLTATQTSDSSVSISLYHLYADGREDSLDIVADIGSGSNPNNQYFASCNGDKQIFFTLSSDCSSIEVSQLGIYPAVDLEYQGIYILEN